ncbi:MAG TPA: ATP-binding protein [bacterium]|nr:ATP-binding protein [bacterium]
MRNSLLWRLLGVQWLVIAVAVIISGVALEQQASHTFMTIMMRYHVDPTMIEAEFQASSRRILLASSLVAAAIAMLMGWILVMRIVRPLKQMMMLAEQIARGDYGRRLHRHGRDEIGRLAESLNQMAASLQLIEGLRRDLVANVAHELRTPLSTLRGYLEALRDGVTAPSPETLVMLHEEVLSLVRLVDDLHQLSQFDARVSHPRSAAVNLRALVGRLVAVYGPEFAHRGMRLSEAYDPFLPPVEADGDLVSQALRNLIDNALRYAPVNAAVTIAARVADGVVRLEVSNNGEDIPPEDLPHIFERFYRGEKSRSRATGGAGIGLAIVQEIARAHGGETGASSADGRTTVWFSLPLGPPAAAAPVRGGPPSGASAEGRW